MATRELQTNNTSAAGYSFGRREAAILNGMGLIRTTLLCGLVLLSTRSFIVSPVFEIVALAEQALLVILVFFLSYLIMIGFASRNYTLDSLDIIMIILGALPFLAAVSAHREYHQPLVHGILAFKDYYLLYAAYLVYYGLKRQFITIRQLETAMAWAAIISLFAFLALSIFTNPAKYADTIISGSQSTKGGGVYYRFNMGLIFYGAIYFFIKGMRKERVAELVLSLLFVIYILFFRLDRTSMVACVFTMVIAWFAVERRHRKVNFLLYFAVPGAIVIAVILTAVPSIWDAISIMFWDALTTLTGENKAAGQALLRNYEAGIVMEQIKEHPILGNGRVSNSWVDGAFDHFYRFFYPGDVGFLGMFFMFGLVGIPMLYSQYVLAALTAFRINWSKSSVFALALIFYLIILFLDSLSNGSLVVYSCQTILALTALYYFAQNQEVHAS